MKLREKKIYFTYHFDRSFALLLSNIPQAYSPELINYYYLQVCNIKKQLSYLRVSVVIVTLDKILVKSRRSPEFHLFVNFFRECCGIDILNTCLMFREGFQGCHKQLNLEELIKIE